MKTKLLLSFILLILPLMAIAQSENPIPQLFEVIGQDVSSSRKSATAVSSKMSKRADNPMFFEIRKVKFPNLKKMAEGNIMNEKSPAYFQFSIPKGKKRATGKILAVPKHIEVDDDGNYTYNAELLYKKDLQGDLTLIHEDGKNFGSMTIGDRSFKIEYVDGEGEFLMELDTDKLVANEACMTSTDKGEKSKSSIESLNKTADNLLAARSSSGGACVVRVLTLFTNAASNVSNPNQFATTGLSELNQSLRNSRIYSSQLTFQSAGIQNVNIPGATIDPQDDLEDLQTNQTIINLRNQAGADLVVILVNRNYLGGGLLGIAPLLDYGNEDTGYVAMVEADASTKVYAHETGHMMGCRHDIEYDVFGNTVNVDNQIPANLSVTAKGHQWYKRNCFFCQKLYRKSVVANGGTGGLPRLYFSNPDVTEESKSRGPTGTSNRNNYRQLLNARSVVSEYDDFAPLIVGIGGPSTVNVGSQYTMSSSVQNCSGSRTYRWERSENGFNYFQVSTSSTYSTYALPVNGNQVYYRLRVTCDGQTVTRTRTVYINDPNGGGPFYAKAELPELEDTSSRSVVYPVPASSELNVLVSSDIEQETEVKLYGIAPFSYEKRLFKGKIRAGENPLLFDISNIPQGIYELKVHSSDGILLEKRILISR
ncbi:M12 family metallo-peptidase [Maribacter algarum]|nr:M12 family metallo-peptidase [Maribacter algarum]